MKTAPDEPTTHPALVLTGERTLPGIPDEAYWFERHVVAYVLVGPSVRGRSVLDAGCGEGYGLALLVGAGATRAVGVDLEAPVVDHVARTYAARDQRIEVLRADLGDLPLPDASVDAAVSFQVIEHLHDVPAYLAELQRVTRPGGPVVIATPNRLTFTPDSDVPVNPFHITEYAPDELRAALTASGLVVESLLGVHHGPRLVAAEAQLGRPLTDVLTSGPPESWPADVRGLVHRVRADWFDVREDDLTASLDLIALCRVGDRR